jgi:hypothetical protein
MFDAARCGNMNFVVRRTETETVTVTEGKLPMANHRETYAGKYLRADEIKKAFRAVIERVDFEKMRDGDDKVVLYFEGVRRGLPLNKTRYDQVVEFTKTYEEDNWLGTEIIVDTQMTKNPQGKTVPGIIIRNGKVKSAARKRKEVKDVLDGDGIPEQGEEPPPNMGPDADDDM